MLFVVERLGEDVCNHVISGLVLHLDLLVFNQLPDEVVLDLDVPGLLAGDRVAGNGQAGSVVLVDDGWMVLLKVNSGQELPRNMASWQAVPRL